MIEYLKELNIIDDPYGTNHMPLITQVVPEAVELKRGGKYDEAESIYIELNRLFPKHPGTLKAWAKICVCKGKYTEAIDKFLKAAKYYEILLNNSEEWQCMNQATILRNRHINSIEFKRYVNSVSAGLITDPPL